MLIFPQPASAWTILFLPLVLGLQWWAWAEALPVTPLNPAILLMAGMLLVSALVTPDPASSLVKVAGVLLGMLVFFTVARHSRTRPGWKAALALFAAAGIGVSVLGLLGSRWFPSKLPQINSILSHLPLRLSGLPGAEAGINVNELAGALCWVVPVLVMAGLGLLVEPRWFASRSGRGKITRSRQAGWLVLLGLANIICAVVLILSQSRDGYLAMLVALPILLLILARGRARTLVAGVLLFAAIGTGILVSHSGLETSLNQAFTGLPARGVAFSMDSLFGRAEIWRRAIWAIREAPVSGLGMNIFRKAIYLQSPPFQNTSFDIAHAHNELLQAALDLGLPGLVSLLALYVGAVGMLVPAIRGRGALRLLALGLLGGMLAHILFGLTDAVALGAKPGFLMWWLLGLAFGIYRQARPSRVAQA